MSIPIRACLAFKAALGDEAAFKRLTEAVDYNLRCVAWTQLPCECDPPCVRPTHDQLNQMNDRLYNAIEALQRERRKNFKPVKFDKIVFPVIKGMSELPKLEDVFNHGK